MKNENDLSFLEEHELEKYYDDFSDALIDFIKNYHTDHTTTQKMGIISSTLVITSHNIIKALFNDKHAAAIEVMERNLRILTEKLEEYKKNHDQYY